MWLFVCRFQAAETVISELSAPLAATHQTVRGYIAGGRRETISVEKKDLTAPADAQTVLLARQITGQCPQIQGERSVMEFKGVFTALITPFKVDGSLDEETYAKLVERQIKSGIAGIVPCGTTGESPTLSLDEHEHVIDVAVELARGKCTVIAGAGSNSTAEATRLSIHAQDAGADAILSVNPYYNKPSQLGLYRHFKSIADAVDIPVVLYNIAGRTGVNLETDTLLKLQRDCSNIIAVKEASGSIAQMKDVINRTAEGFSVLSGDDGMALELVQAGGDGVISVASNLLPEKMSNIVELALAGRFEEARAANDEMQSLYDVLFVETNPIPVKTAMAMMGLCEEVFRLPLCELSTNENRARLTEVLKNLNLL